MPLLSVKNLQLHYETPAGQVRAVDSVSFSVETEGHALGIIGETGSGKSSLVMALTRVLPRNTSRYEGEVSFRGRDLMSLSAEEFRRTVRWKDIAVVFQGAMNGFNPVLKIGDQLIERMLIEPGGKRRDARAQIEQLLSSVGLSPDVYERYPHELSGGMKQRAAIAMALSLKAPLIILDEPTSALDVSVQAQIMNVLKRLKWELGISMIFVTHDIALASDLCDDVAVMYAGQMREYGGADDVLRKPLDPYTQELIASVPLLHGEERPQFVSGSAPDPISPPAGCRFHERCRRTFGPCADKAPLFFEPVEGHGVRCWLYDPSAGDRVPAEARNE